MSHFHTEELQQRYAAAKNLYMQHLITDAVLHASLFGLGLRGQDLDAEYKLIQMERLERMPKKTEPANVLVMERDGTSATLRFTTGEAAGHAVTLLRKQPNVLFACRVRKYEAEPYVPGLFKGDNNTFVAHMLSLM